MLGITIGDIKGDTRSLDSSSYGFGIGVGNLPHPRLLYNPYEATNCLGFPSLPW